MRRCMVRVGRVTKAVTAGVLFFAGLALMGWKGSHWVTALTMAGFAAVAVGEALARESERA